MANYVYILGSFSGTGPRTYVGWTNDLEKRLTAHNNGSGAKSTRGRLWVLLYAEKYRTRTEAMSREWHLKRDRTLRKRVTAGFVPEKVPPNRVLKNPGFRPVTDTGMCRRVSST